MKLIIEELKAVPILQKVTPSKNTIIEAIRPHIYRHNFASGSMKLQILDSISTVIAESEKININAIGTMAFYHGYVRFYIDAYLKQYEHYTIQLLGDDGYTFDESAYCGWANGFDLEKYPMSPAPAGDVYYPFDLEIWERTEK